MPASLSVDLSDEERAHLSTFLHRGRANARTLTRARVLLKLADDWDLASIGAALEVSEGTIRRVRQRYAEGGLEHVLHDRVQARRRQALTGAQQAHLVAIACSPVPESHDHWTLRLLAGQMIELGYVRGISPETIRQALKKTR